MRDTSHNLRRHRRMEAFRTERLQRSFGDCPRLPETPSKRQLPLGDPGRSGRRTALPVEISRDLAKARACAQAVGRAVARKKRRALFSPPPRCVVQCLSAFEELLHLLLPRLAQGFGDFLSGAEGMGLLLHSTSWGSRISAWSLRIHLQEPCATRLSEEKQDSYDMKMTRRKRRKIMMTLMMILIMILLLILMIWHDVTQPTVAMSSRPVPTSELCLTLRRSTRQ